MDDGENSPTCGKTRPTGYGVPNRGHQEMEGVKGNLPRPIRRSEGRAETTVAMAGGRELSGAHD